MDNKEKAQEICEKNKRFHVECSSLECYLSAMEMSQWKEQQVIEYLYKNIQSLLNDYGVSEASADLATKLFLANFKQAMEEKP